MDRLDGEHRFSVFTYGTAKKILILLADDLVLVREGIACICETTGLYSVTDQCGMGQRPSDQATKPDIAILDLNIPRLFSLIVRKVRELNLSTRMRCCRRGDEKTGARVAAKRANGASC